MVQPQDLIAIGNVCKPHGIKGALLISSGYGDALYPGMELLIGGERFKILSLRQVRNGLLVQLGNVLTRSEAEALCGSVVYVDAAHLPSLPEGEFYWHEIIGIRVIADGIELGRVVDILRTGAHDIYVVHSDDKREYLLPAVEEIVRHIDVQQGIMLVSPPDGLLDINAL